MAQNLRLRRGSTSVEARRLEFWYDPETQETSRERPEKSEDSCLRVTGLVNRFSMESQRQFARRHRRLQRMQAELEAAREKDPLSEDTARLEDSVEELQADFSYQLLRDVYSDITGITGEKPTAEGSEDLVEFEVKSIDSRELFDDMPITLVTEMAEGVMDVFPNIRGVGGGAEDAEEGPTVPPGAGG